jgi:hypothetical protein
MAVIGYSSAVVRVVALDVAEAFDTALFVPKTAVTVLFLMADGMTSTRLFSSMAAIYSTFVLRG